MSTTSVPAEPAAGGTVSGGLGERRLTTIHPIGQSLAVGPIFSAGTFLVTAVYVVLALVGFRLVWETRPDGGLWWKLPAAVAGLAVPILAYKGSLDPWPDYPNNRGIIFALVCLGIVAIWYAYLKMRHPDRIRRAATYAESHHA